jgi:hypothetical protein
MWLLLCSHIVKAQDNRTVSLDLRREVNICNVRGDEFTFTVEMGEFVKEDQFFGYDLGIKFDNTKLIIDRFLPLNTLTEFFDDDKRGANFLTEGDTTTIFVYGVTFSQTNSVVGDRPLVAFQGKFIGNCQDSGFINIDWLDFTSEFTDVISDTNNLVIRSQFEKDSSRKIESTIFLNNAEDIQKDSTVQLSVLIDRSERDFELADFKFSLTSNDRIIIEEFELNNAEYDFEEIENTMSKIAFNATVKNEILQDTLLTVVLKNNSEIENHENSIVFEVEPIDDCSCIRVGDRDSINITGKYDPVSVQANRKFLVSQYNDHLKISSSKEIINIEMYDIFGKNVIKVDNIYRKNYIVKTNGFSNGIYFIKIQDAEKTEIRKTILI